MQIKIALPKGRLLNETAAFLSAAGLGLEGYSEDTRLYRIESQRFPNLHAKVFHEKDIPVQVAIGNYDLGICGLEWIEELLVKYPSSGLVKAKDLGFAATSLYIAGSGGSSLDTYQAGDGVVRIASEYPNLAESFALKWRLKRFSIFPIWGGAEVYPPENADLVLLSGGERQELFNGNLAALFRVLDSSTFLIANRDSWESKDLSEIVASIYSRAKRKKQVTFPAAKAKHIAACSWKDRDDMIRLALPDGHQQKPTLELLNKAGIKIEDYPSSSGNRRPSVDLEGVVVKVIRPQDMPLQVANSSFDLAISGRDWLKEHLNKFPSSPVTELVDLRYGKVRIVAVVSGDLPVDDVASLRKLNARRQVLFRVASEYVSIADKYAGENRLGFFRVIPTWGATEAFLPDDADLLIENTQTGRTIAQHGLKIIDTLFESTACLISNSRLLGSEKGKKIESIAEILSRAVEDAT